MGNCCGKRDAQGISSTAAKGTAKQIIATNEIPKLIEFLTGFLIKSKLT